MDREATSLVALLGMMAGWIVGDTSDLLRIIIAYKPESPLQSAANAAQKLKANVFLLVDEIDEIWAKEKTPNVLE